MPPSLQCCKFIHYGVLEVICFLHNLLAALDLVVKVTSVFVSSLVKILNYFVPKVSLAICPTLRRKLIIFFVRELWVIYMRRQ